MRAIRKVTSGKLLTKQTMTKNVILKNSNILQLFRNEVTAGTEALVVSGSKFLHACVKVVRRL
jgi:hypothetical protein